MADNHVWARARTPRRAALILALLLGLGPAFVSASAQAKPAPAADMAILSVSDSPDPVFTGGTLKYQVGVGNLGPDRATAVVLSTQLPAGVTFEPELSNSQCAAAGGEVSCSFASWDVNAAGIVMVTVSPSTAGTLELVFTVRATESDPNLSNNTRAVTTEVVVPTEADVSFSLSGASSYYVGAPIFFSFNVGNAGPATATGITVTLVLSHGLTPVNAGSCTPTATVTTCTLSIGSLAPGTGVSGILEVRATEQTRYSVHGTVTADQPDPVTSNNADSFGFTATFLADLSVQVTESADPVLPGMPVTYTATIANLGPSPATGVRLVDSWSATTGGGVELLSFAASENLSCAQTSSGAQSITCTTATLNAGASATVRITLRPLGVGAVTDGAVVRSLVDDPDMVNNRASETTTVGPA